MASSSQRPGPGAAPLDAPIEPARAEGRGGDPTRGIETSQVRVTGLDGIMTADRRRLLETQEIGGIGSWDWYVDADAVVWTPELYRIYGIDPEDFGGTYDAYLELVHPDDRAATQRKIRETLETHEPFVSEHRIVLPDGEVRTLEARGRCDLDADGNLVKLTGTCQDITARLRAQEELREAHERYRSLIEAIPAISYIDSLGPTVKTIFVSPQLADILGYEMTDVGPGFWASKLHQDDRDEVIERRRNAYVRGEDFSCEYRVVAADGRAVWVSDQAAIVRDEDGTPIFAQGIMTDISERKRLEDQLIQSQKMDALGRLAGGIAHDFNNLLTAILGNTQLLLDEPDPAAEEVGTGLVEIQEAALLGAELVSQLLGFTRAREGVARTTDLSRVVASTEGLLRRVIGEDVSLTTEVPAIPLPVRIEESQVIQIIMNLVVNAREAMPDGGRIAIDAFLLDDPNGLDDGFMVGSDLLGGERGIAGLRVSDSGTGIEEALRPLVFEPFFTTKARGDQRGTGLGLANVYAIVTRAGGCISISGGPGQGTSFTILFPLEASRDDEVIVLDPLRADPAGEVILVVEDDDRVRRITTTLLQRAGYQVLQASDGTTGLQIALNERVDVLVTDVVMPGMDGKALASLVLEEQPDVGVLFMSGYAEQLDSSDLDRPGFTYLQKPFTREDLESKLAEVIRTTRRDPA